MPNRRRTPTQERARATVKAILEATAQVLVEDGYAQLSTNRVARRAGVSVGTLYQYFEDKDALIASLASEVAANRPGPFQAKLRDIADKPFDVAAETLIRGLLDMKRAEGELGRVLARHVPAAGSEEDKQRLLARFVELFTATLRNRTDIRDVDVQLASFVLVHGVFGVVQQVIAHRPELIEDGSIDAVLIDLCSRFLRPDPPGDPPPQSDQQS